MVSVLGWDPESRGDGMGMRLFWVVRPRKRTGVSFGMGWDGMWTVDQLSRFIFVGFRLLFCTSRLSRVVPPPLARARSPFLSSTHSTYTHTPFLPHIFTHSLTHSLSLYILYLSLYSFFLIPLFVVVSSIKIPKPFFVFVFSSLKYFFFKFFKPLCDDAMEFKDIDRR